MSSKQGRRARESQKRFKGEMMSRGQVGLDVPLSERNIVPVRNLSGAALEAILKGGVPPRQQKKSKRPDGGSSGNLNESAGQEGGLNHKPKYGQNRREY